MLPVGGGWELPESQSEEEEEDLCVEREAALIFSWKQKIRSIMTKLNVGTSGNVNCCI